MLLEKHIKGALHPKSFVCYLQAEDGNLAAESEPVPRELEAIPAALPRPKFPFRFGAVFVPRESDTIPATLPLLREVAQRGKAWDVPQSHEAAGDLGSLAPECLVPILGRNSGLTGDRKSTRLNSSHSQISYAVFCLKKKKCKYQQQRRYTLCS